MTSGVQFFKQNMPTQTVAGRLSAGAGPVEALTISDVATQVALALIANTIPHSFATLPGTPSTPTTWAELVGTIEAAQSWTIGSSVIYTAAAGGFFGTDHAISFYNGVLWANEQVAGSSDVVDVLNFSAASPLIYQHNYGASRVIHGAVNQQSLPPGKAYLMPPNPDNNAYFVTFDGTVTYFDQGAIATESIIRIDEDDSVNVFFIEYVNSSHRIGKYSSINFSAHTATLTQNIQDPGNLAFNSCCVDSRCYIRIQTTGIGWLHTTTNALTTLKTFANACSIPLIGGSFGGGANTAIFVQSGETNQANRLQKRDLNGTLVAEATLTSVSATGYNTITSMAYDYVNDHVWAQSAAGLHCVQCGTMTEIGFIAAASLVCELVQPIGHPSGGVFAFTDKSGSYYTTVSRVSVTAA